MLAMLGGGTGCSSCGSGAQNCFVVSEGARRRGTSSSLKKGICGPPPACAAHPPQCTGICAHTSVITDIDHENRQTETVWFSKAGPTSLGRQSVPRARSTQGRRSARVVILATRPVLYESRVRICVNGLVRRYRWNSQNRQSPEFNEQNHSAGQFCSRRAMIYVASVTAHISGTTSEVRTEPSLSNGGALTTFDLKSGAQFCIHIKKRQTVHSYRNQIFGAAWGRGGKSVGPCVHPRCEATFCCPG